MLTRIDVVADETITLPVIGASTAWSYLLKKVTGLNPPDIDLFVGEYARDGGLYSGRRVSKRAVGLLVDPNPQLSRGETAASLRARLYRAFIDPNIRGDQVELHIFEDDGSPTKVLRGYTEKFEHDLFEKDTVTNVSLLCPDPYIRSLEETVYPDANWSENTFEYTGSAETGFTINLKVITATNRITMGVDDTRDPGNYIQVDLTGFGGFLPNDIVSFNTNYGHRNVTLTRGSNTSSIFSSVTSQSKWPQLHSRLVTIRIGANTPNDLVVASGYDFAYVASYWGI